LADHQDRSRPTLGPPDGRHARPCTATPTDRRSDGVTRGQTPYDVRPLPYCVDAYLRRPPPVAGQPAECVPTFHPSPRPTPAFQVPGPPSTHPAGAMFSPPTLPLQDIRPPAKHHIHRALFGVYSASDTPRERILSIRHTTSPWELLGLERTSQASGTRGKERSVGELVVCFSPAASFLVLLMFLFVPLLTRIPLFHITGPSPPNNKTQFIPRQHHSSFQARLVYDSSPTKVYAAKKTASPTTQPRETEPPLQLLSVSVVVFIR
jgi:hypothetical protein